MAARVIARAKSIGFDELHASVDAFNVDSVRVLERLGFELVDTKQGAFGDLFVYRRELRSA
jgi:RimJ/RimL family protein N-acetyltransferase